MDIRSGSLVIHYVTALNRAKGLGLGVVTGHGKYSVNVYCFRVNSHMKLSIDLFRKFYLPLNSGSAPATITV